MENNDDKVLSREKEALVKKYGKSAEHIFQAIVMRFMPKEKSGSLSPTANLNRRILCCLSYFHYNGLPRYLLESCCHSVRDISVEKPTLRNESDIGFFVNKLKDFEMCNLNKSGDVTFHEVVLNAFRFRKRTIGENFCMLKKAIEVMCGLVSMDIRKNKNRNQMYLLRPHFEALLHHVSSIKKIREKHSLLLNALTSHLYEVAGAIILYKSRSEKSEKMFHSSLKIIWPDMLHVIIRKDQSADEIAQIIVEKSQLMGKELSEGFIFSYSSCIKLSHFEEKQLEFLSSQSKDSFEIVENGVQNLNFSAPELVTKLQQLDWFLSDEKFRPIFFAERFASIMHRWSRYHLTVSSGVEKSINESIEKGLWMSSLSNAVSRRVYELYEVRLMTEWLSYTSGMIPLLMKQKNEPKSLRRAQNLGKKMMENEELKVYENGLLAKAFYPPQVTRMFLLRNLVRINARLICKTTDEQFLREADEQCQHLLDIISSTSPESEDAYMSIGSTLVYCGKYYGARKNFKQAFNCFNKYFDLLTKPGFEKKFHTECWAVVNYVRAVCSQPLSPNKEDATKRCISLFKRNEVIENAIKKRLKSFCNQLEITV